MGLPQTFYRWKAYYGGMGLKKPQRMRDLEREDTEFQVGGFRQNAGATAFF